VARRRFATRVRLGGNVSQERVAGTTGGWPCYRAAETFATPILRRSEPEHPFFMRTLRCRESVRFGPGPDRAGCKFVVQTPTREVVDAEDYFVGPEVDITRNEHSAAGHC